MSPQDKVEVWTHGRKFNTWDPRPRGQKAGSIRSNVHLGKGGRGRIVGRVESCSGGGGEGGGCGSAGDTDDVLEALEADGVHDFAIEEV